jgi:hypothetical protein
MDAWAQEQEPYVRIHMPYAPQNTPVLNALMDNSRAQLFAKVVRMSEVTKKDLGIGNVVFLVPRDDTCTGSQRAYLESLVSNGPARAYVLDHVFKGDLTILPDANVGQARLAYYYPAAGTKEPLLGRVAIDEHHPFSVPLLNGRSVLISINHGVVHVGARSAVLHSNNGAGDGDELELDQCATF